MSHLHQSQHHKYTVADSLSQTVLCRSFSTQYPVIHGCSTGSTPIHQNNIRQANKMPAAVSLGAVSRCQRGCYTCTVAANATIAMHGVALQQCQVLLVTLTADSDLACCSKMAVTAVCLSSDDRKAYSVSKDGSIFVIDLESCKRTKFDWQRTADRAHEDVRKAEWMKRKARSIGKNALLAVAISSDDR